jgi:hypothetical protein
VREYDDAARAFLSLLEGRAASGRLTLVYESPPREKVRIYRVPETPRR